MDSKPTALGAETAIGGEPPPPPEKPPRDIATEGEAVDLDGFSFGKAAVAADMGCWSLDVKPTGLGVDGLFSLCMLSLFSILFPLAPNGVGLAFTKPKPVPVPPPPLKALVLVLPKIFLLLFPMALLLLPPANEKVGGVFAKELVNEILAKGLVVTVDDGLFCALSFFFFFFDCTILRTIVGAAVVGASFGATAATILVSDALLGVMMVVALLLLFVVFAADDDADADGVDNDKSSSLCC